MKLMIGLRQQRKHVFHEAKELLLLISAVVEITSQRTGVICNLINSTQCTSYHIFKTIQGEYHENNCASGNKIYFCMYQSKYLRMYAYLPSPPTKDIQVKLRKVDEKLMIFHFYTSVQWTLSKFQRNQISCGKMIGFCSVGRFCDRVML